MQRTHIVTICLSTLAITGWLSFGCSGATDCQNLGTCKPNDTGGGEISTVATTGTGETSCHSSGTCTNGTNCSIESECASGFCADGVCCDSACNTACVSCSLEYNRGQCISYEAGTDPEGDCSEAMCNGLAGCVQPSCSHILSEHPEAKNQDGVYLIRPNDSPTEAFQAYCNMTDHNGGWTLAMKANGSSPMLHYDAGRWENKSLLNKNSFNIDEESNAKLEPWNHVPVSHIMIGMRALGGGALQYRVLDVGYTENLHELFSSSTRETNLGRTQWLSMVPGMNIQEHCNKEGINIEAGHNDYAKVRIGIIGNNEEDSCDTADSYAGLGGSNNILHCGDFSNQQTTGSMICWPEPEGIPAFAVLFVRRNRQLRGEPPQLRWPVADTRHREVLP